MKNIFQVVIEKQDPLRDWRASWNVLPIVLGYAHQFTGIT